MCAGQVKSILDIGKTLEYLETQGVCVATLSPDEGAEFPAFFTRSSGFRSPYRVADPAQAARLIHHGLDGGGMLIAVPIPADQEADGRLIEEAIQSALARLGEGVSGKEVTPFLLAEVNRLTSGASLKASKSSDRFLREKKCCWPVSQSFFFPFLPRHGPDPAQRSSGRFYRSPAGSNPQRINNVSPRFPPIKFFFFPFALPFKANGWLVEIDDFPIHLLPELSIEICYIWMCPPCGSYIHSGSIFQIPGEGSFHFMQEFNAAR